MKKILLSILLLFMNVMVVQAYTINDLYERLNDLRMAQELYDSLSSIDIIGNKYETIQKEFEGYTFISVDGETTDEYIDGTIYVTYYYDKNIGTGDIEPPQTGLDFGRISTSQIEIVLYRKEEE